jgi:hypothetical protein
MNDLSPQENRKYFIEKFGKDIGSFGLDSNNQSIVNYVDGLPIFDEFLSGFKFENTSCTLHLFGHENGIWLLMMSPSEESCSINIWKDEIKSVVAYHNQSIKIARKSAFINLLKSGAAGLLWFGVGHLSDHILKKVKPVEAKSVIGSIYEYRIKPRQGGELILRLSTVKENKHLVSKFLDKHYQTNLANKDDIRYGCFIATVCFSDPYADEVNNFRIYRDEVLIKSFVGRQLIKAYYKTSPTIANFLYQRETLKKMAKTLLVIVHKLIKK